MIYLDIDMDYFVKPVFKNSINGIRMYKNQPCEVSDVYSFYKKLTTKLTIPEEKHIFTNHRKSYIYWWIKKHMGCTLIHIDAHSDLYRNKQKDLRVLNDIDMNCDDYIWYGIREGFIKEIFWVCPDGLVNFDDCDIAYKMLGDRIVRKAVNTEGQIDIEFEVIDYSGRGCPVSLHILEIDTLPVFKDAPCILTFATSPEFIPLSADSLIDDIQTVFCFDSSVVDSLKSQHAAMPDKSAE